MSLLRPKNLIELGQNLFATRHTYYHKNSRDYVREYAEKLGSTVIRINEELGLLGHRFILRPLPSDLNGLTFPSISTAYIDPRRKIKNLIFTFCHEALHLQQVQENRLVWDRNKQGVLWEGKLFEVSQNSDDDWRNLPWEIDVFKKENQLFLKVSDYKKPPKVYR